MKPIFAFFIAIAFIACKTENKHLNYSLYSDDISLLNLNTKCIELKANTYSGKICICPEYQAKVMTSSSNSELDMSYGWINRSVLGSNYTGNGSDLGGEDRVWIGPLGGQHSFYYGQEKPLNEDNWQVPDCMNAEPYEIVYQTSKHIQLKKEMSLTNFVGTELNMLVERKISLLEKDEIESKLKIDLFELDFVAYSSEHTLTNLDSSNWKKPTGLATLWSLGMFEGSDSSVTIIPLSKKCELRDINTYLGHLDEKRIKISDHILMFKTDGKYRSKIGIPPHLAPSIYGNYKPETNTLTIIEYQHRSDSLYFNSEVSVQDNPYIGEVIPIYNNGSMDYSPVNKASFFELESSAPCRELAPNESLHHYHRVYHLTGSISKLNVISEIVLGTNLTTIVL